MPVMKEFIIYTRPDGSTFSVNADENPEVVQNLLNAPENQGATGQSVQQMAEDYNDYGTFAGMYGSSLADVGAAAGELQNAPGSGAGFVQVLMPNGATARFSIKDFALDRALQGGARVLGRDGKPMQMQQLGGGWVGIDVESGIPLPLNIISGQDWEPGQQDLIGQWMQQNLGGGGGGGGNAPGFGSLPEGYFAEPFDEQFQFDPTQYLESPGYKHLMAEGVKALDRSAAAKGSLLSGAQLKGITEFGQGLASAGYGDEWQRQMGEFAQKRDIHRTNRSDIFGRFASLADVGLPATSATANYSGQYADAASGIYGQQANAQASGRIGAGNAWRDALSRIANPYLLSRIGAGA